MAKEHKVSVILPPGIARFPNLWVPRRFEKPGQKPGELKYETGVVYSAADMKKIEKIYKDAWAKFADPKLDDDERKEYLAAFKSPFKKDKKDKSIKFLNAHSSAKYKPPIFDAELEPVRGEFGGGSVIVLDVSIVPYDGFGGGLTTYINAVQLLKKEAAGGFTGPRFEKAEGYKASEDEDDEPAPGSRFQKGGSDDDDDAADAPAEEGDYHF